MTNFEVLRCFTDVKEFSKMVYEFVKKNGTVEALIEDLSWEIPEEGLQTLKSAAQNGYPLSFDGKQ